MKIIEGIKIKGAPVEIPDCGRDNLPQFFLDMGYKVGAEIGTSKGVFAEKICKAGLKLYAIDPWLDYPDYCRGDKGWQRTLNNQFEQTKALLAPYDNHEFQYVTNDIAEWSKKIRKGGCISGHDYFFSNPHGFERIHVKEVVNAYTHAYKIYPWYVLGRKEKVAGEVRDNFRSFMWIKQ
jgi:hypothetical protein